MKAIGNRWVNSSAADSIALVYRPPLLLGTLLAFCCFSTEHTFSDLRRKSEFPLALVFCHCDKTPGEDNLEEFLWAHSLGVQSVLSGKAPGHCMQSQEEGDE